MKSKFDKFYIGQIVKHGPSYPMTCSERFCNVYDPEDRYTTAKELKNRPSEPRPIALSGESVVIGLRRAIMSNYRYSAPSQSGGYFEPPEYEPGYASGKFEVCLVCVSSIKKFKPFLVRIKDINENTNTKEIANPPTTDRQTES